MPLPLFPAADAQNNSTANSVTACLEAAERGAVIVTSNQRAARFLQARMNQIYRVRGLTSWPTPSIFHWNAWLTRQWELAMLEREQSDAPVLLSSEQEHALWLQIIAGAGAANPFAHDGLANMAQQAWTLLWDYGVDLATLQRASKPRADWEQFSEWAAKFQRRIVKAQWLTQAQLAGELQRRLAANPGATSGELVLWGFDAFTPAQESLLNGLQQSCRVTRVAPSYFETAEQSASAETLDVPARDDEFRAAARWASSHLKRNPLARLAIITTQAAEDRGALQRALSFELAPQQYGFTLGRPLTNFALVRTALLLVRLQQGWLSAAEIGDVLVAPQLASSDEERGERALFEANVFRRRTAADPAMDLAVFARWLRGVASSRSASLNKLLRQCDAAMRLLPRQNVRRGAEDWADHFAQTLAAFDYPGGALSSVEFQTWERWEQLLQSFVATSISGETLAHAEALARVRRMAAEIIFQPESGDAVVEIMGPLEAAGSLFDGIFFTGCTDSRWPLDAPVSPLLPLELQRAAGMPGAVMGANLQRATQMTERILRSAPEVLFSYAKRGKDGELRPSPVLRKLRIADAEPTLRGKLCIARVRAVPAFEEIDDTFGPEWPQPGPALATSALRSQAACPFQAFALYRLHARGEDLAEEGLDARQRGNLVHEALQKVWSGGQGLKTSAALHELIHKGTLEDFVKLRVAEALPAASEGWQREYFQIERDRLTRLICEWLVKVEAERADFQVLEAEKYHDLKLLASLKFRVRPDRVDALLSAQSAEHPRELVLLDYKTGRPNNKAWNTPRMDEPQLPLYALYAFPETPVAIALGHIRGGDEPCVKGAAVSPGILPGKQKISNEAHFAECVAAWRTDLEDMAEEFVAGNATVMPKYGITTCRYCTLQPLCRVHETERLLEKGDDDSAEATDG